MEAMDRNLAVATLQESFTPERVSDIMRSVVITLTLAPYLHLDPHPHPDPRQVVRCVHRLHRRGGRIHGDITQANIMRTKDGRRWKLIDLDCSCRVSVWSTRHPHPSALTLALTLTPPLTSHLTPHPQAG